MDSLSCFSILEGAVDPSYTIFFLGTWQKRRFCILRLSGVASGCITILQAEKTKKKEKKVLFAP
jgi:hypothetical protein